MEKVDRVLMRWASQVRYQLRYHLWPLIAMAITYLFAQLCTLAQAPITYISPDSPSYVVVAQQLSGSLFHNFVQPWRTPGYPMFLWFIDGLTRTPLTSMMCTPTSSNIAACNQAFIPFVYAQAVVYGITVLEVYLLAYWLTRKRGMAAVAAIVATCNLYMYSWERVIGTELLSFWALVTVLLIFVRYMRRPTLWWGGVLGLALFASVMIRPFNEFVPVLLAALALGRALWTQGWQGLRAYWKSALCMLLVVYGLLFAYIQLNGHINDAYDLSYVTNIDLMGKMLEYRMQNEPVPAQYATLQAEANAYLAANGGDSVWGFISMLESTHQAPTSPAYHYQDFGDFARHIILHHPLTFAQRSLPDIFRAWIITDYEVWPDYGFGQSYPQPDGGLPYLQPGISAFDTVEGTVPASAQPVWVRLWLVLSTLEELSFGLLPLVLLGSLVWLWRYRTSEVAYYVLVLAALALLGILISALGASDSYQRLRFPVEWAMYLANILAGLYLREVIELRPAEQRSTGTHGAEGGTAPVPTGAGAGHAGAADAPLKADEPGYMNSRNTVSSGVDEGADIPPRPVRPGAWPSP